MASSLSFDPGVKELLTHDVVDKYRIIPMQVRKGKLCLIAQRPLTDEALLDLKHHTGFEDYELQLVGDDVLVAYIDSYKTGKLFSFLP